jgi:plastocyanin
MKFVFTSIIAFFCLSTTPAATFRVDMINLSFQPPTVTINAGDTVIWTQKDTTTHTVTSGPNGVADGLFDSGNMNLNQTFSHTFNSPGTFPYFCVPHRAFQRGTVIVQASANPPPSISITAPQGGANIAAGIATTITANATDNGSVTSVQFFDNGNPIGTDTSAPYSVSVTLASGAHTLTARATDNQGASTTSTGVTVTVSSQNQPPVISITSPANNATVTGPSVTLEANASDPDGTITKVEFLESRTSLGSATASPFRIQVNLAPGPHTIRAQATDDKGTVTSANTVTFTVAAANNPPAVSLTSPANNASFTAPATVQVVANATDSDGSISKVEFLRDGNVISTITAAPFQTTMQDLPAGTYTLSARAADNAGAVTTSSSVSITVNGATTVAAARITSPAIINGQIQFTVQGTDAANYGVEGASTPRGPWTRITTKQPSGGSFNFSESLSGPSKYYRVLNP